MNTIEITIYTKGDKIYCEDCKPKGGKRGTLVLSSYDHYCSGCGEDFKEMAEDALSPAEVVELEAIMAEPTLGPYTMEEMYALVQSSQDVPPMPPDVAALYEPVSSGDLYEPPIPAPIWDGVEDDEPERPYQSGSLDRPDSIVPSSKIGLQVPFVSVLATKSTGSVYLADGLLAGNCEITDQGYSEEHRCNIGIALVQGEPVAVRCIGAWTWQELAREEVQS